MSATTYVKSQGLRLLADDILPDADYAVPAAATAAAAAAVAQ
jgi:hypothetical protein